MPSQAAPLLIAPAAILSETNWLERLAETRVEPAAWAAIPQRIVMLAAAAVPDALAALYAEGGAYDFTAVQDRLTRRFGPPAAIPVGIDPMVLTTSMDVRVAEQRLLRSLVKDSDGFMAPPGVHRSDTKSNHHSLGCHRAIWRALFSVRVLALADCRRAPVPDTFDCGWM
jgi:hypothetical protein